MNGVRAYVVSRTKSSLGVGDDARKSFPGPVGWRRCMSRGGKALRANGCRWGRARVTIRQKHALGEGVGGGYSCHA